MKSDGTAVSFLKAFLTFNAFRWQDYLFLICCCQSAQHVSGKQMGLRDTCVDLGTFKWCTVADCQRHLQGWKRLTWFSLSVLNDVWRNSDSIKMFSWFFLMARGPAVLQGNGHERDFLDDRRVFIMDMYNRYIYPGDEYAKSEWKAPSIFLSNCLFWPFNS